MFLQGLDTFSGRIGEDSTIAFFTSPTVSEEKGEFPDKSSNSKIPNAHQSTAFPCPKFLTISGAEKNEKERKKEGELMRKKEKSEKEN